MRSGHSIEVPCRQLTFWTRIRKVKCDQTRPACNRCVSTGRTCDGEIGTASRSVAARERLIEPRPDATHRTPAKSIVQAPVYSESLPILSFVYEKVSPWAGVTTALSNYEIHGFRHFQVVTAPAMQMILPSSDWIPVALQVSHQHPAILHAIIATGTLARALTVLIHPSFPRPVLHDLTEEAVRQFRKAIRVLREYVDKAVTSSVAIEPILLSCLLCVCFEAFRGRKSAALRHARLGWNIVNDQSTRTNMTSSPSATFLSSISPHHTGADALFDHKEHHDSHCCLEPRSPIPDVFTSVQEAANHLTKLAKDAEHFRTELLRLAKAHIARMPALHGLLDEVTFCLSTCLSRTVAISDHLQSRFEQLKTAHLQWEHAYALHKQTFAETDVESHLILRTRYFYSKYALATCRDTEEILADQFMRNFKDTLDCIEHYLTVVDRKGMHFFGHSILPALHLIAHKCRDRRVRSRALHILFTAHKQEGLEYSGTLGMYAQAVAEIEDQRGAMLAQQPIGVDEHLQPLQLMLSEEARMADCVTTGQGARGIFGLTCARYVHQNIDAKELEVLQYEGGAVPLRLISSRRFVV